MACACGRWTRERIEACRVRWIWWSFRWHDLKAWVIGCGCAFCGVRHAVVGHAIAECLSCGGLPPGEASGAADVCTCRCCDRAVPVHAVGPSGL